MEKSNPPSHVTLALNEFTGSDLRLLALQTRSHVFRDYLARQITNGVQDYNGLITLLRGNIPQIILRPQRATLLAQIVAAQRSTPQDPRDALLIFERVIETYDRIILTNDEKVVYLDLLDRFQRTNQLNYEMFKLGIEGYAPGDAAVLNANAKAAQEGPGSVPWLQSLNALFALDELSPVSLAPGEAAVLDRLESTSPAGSADGPLVTVIVPTWQPGPWLWTAVRSLTQQTYENLQILIMDDHSGPRFSSLLDSLLDMDSRINLIISPQNRGTYASRNAAIRASAQGDYITIQDDDDWSHPERIERQVRFSQERKLALSMCRAARVTEDLRFVRRAATYIRRGYPTTLVSRQTFTEIGFWDPVRRNSDFEFIRRARRSRKPTGDLGKAPMLLQRHREGSLSSSEVWEGYSEQARRWQNWLASEWHDRSLKSGSRIYMGSGAALSRPYPAPVGLTRTGSSTSPLTVDALVVSDYGGGSASEVATLTVADALLSQGKRIGLLHVDTIRPLAHEISEAVAALCRREGVSIFSWNDELISDVAHVMAPAGLLMCDAGMSKVSARSVIVYGSDTNLEVEASTLFHLKEPPSVSYVGDPADGVLEGS